MSMWTVLYYLRHPYASGLQTLLDVEWTEGSAQTWPHCCTQARCWMHYSPAHRWCDCRCVWCKAARRWRSANWQMHRVRRLEVDPTELQPGDLVLELAEHDLSGCHCDVRVLIEREIEPDETR